MRRDHGAPGARAKRPRVARALHVADAEGPRPLAGALALALVGWLPTVLLAGWQVAATGAWPPVALAFETHVRYLVAGPLLLLGDRAMHARIVRCVHELATGGFIRPADLATYRAVAVRAQRLRASSVAALGCFGLALATIAATPPGTDAASRWESTVGLTAFRFVLLVELWRWAVWAHFLARLSRFDLVLVATHPDLVGGLELLCLPSEAFGTFVFGVGCVVAARWGTLVVHGLPFLSFKNEVTLFGALMTLLGTLPILPFTGQLLRLRIRALREHGAFARDYCARFEAKWLRSRASDPLGTQDVQALADLAHAFDRVERLRPVLATPRLAATLALAALLPTVPLFMTVVPLEEVLPRLLKVL